MTCLVNPSLVEMDLNSISGYLHRMTITLVWVWAPSPVAELQSESHPYCDVGAAGGGCGFKEVVKYSAVLQFGENNAELQPGVFVHVLDICSWYMEKKCSRDCKIKHAKVRKCQDVDFPIFLHVCLVIQSLITQLHAAFSTEFLHPSVHGMPAFVSKRSYLIFCFLLIAPHDIIQAAQWRRNYGFPHGFVLVFCSSSWQHKCFMNALCSGPVWSWVCSQPHLQIMGMQEYWGCALDQQPYQVFLILSSPLFSSFPVSHFKSQSKFFPSLTWL